MMAAITRDRDTPSSGRIQSSSSALAAAHSAAAIFAHRPRAPSRATPLNTAVWRRRPRPLTSRSIRAGFEAKARSRDRRFRRKARKPRGLFRLWRPVRCSIIAAEAVELPDDEHVSLPAACAGKFVESRTVVAYSGGEVVVDVRLIAPRVAQGVALQVRRLDYHSREATGRRARSFRFQSAVTSLMQLNDGRKMTHGHG